MRGFRGVSIGMVLKQRHPLCSQRRVLNPVAQACEVSVRYIFLAGMQLEQSKWGWDSTHEAFEKKLPRTYGW